jgi:hypothetical protein
MAHPGMMVNVTADGTPVFQKINSFSVNINSKYLNQRLMPAMHLLLHDLPNANPARDQVTLVGLNSSDKTARLNIQLQGFAEGLAQTSFDYYRTSETENCHLIGQSPARGRNWPFNGLDVAVPPASIFTLTSVRP